MLVAVIVAAVHAAVVAVATPSPAPSPTPRFSLGGNGENVFVDQATRGPGTQPPEGPRFAAGSPISPMSPYDWFTSAPVTPGVAGVAQYRVTGTYHATGVDFAATLGFGGVNGSTTNALYWSEPLIPNLNDHALSRVVPYAIVFPTHAGQDDASVVSAALLGASASAPDGSWRVRGGYFDLAQSDRFVFAPPPLTSVVPSLGAQTAETLGPGMPTIKDWPASPSSLPLLGVDGTWHHGGLSAEVTDALLPALPNTNLRLTMGSLALDRGDVGRFSVQVGHFWTSGDPISTTTFFGVSPHIYRGVQGRLFTSTLAGQTETIAGARAFFHPARSWDLLAELGRAWYDASLVRFPGASHFGNYEHFKLARHIGKDVASIEYHRFDPTYATLIAPYGIPENIWSVAWSWPGVWLKSTYQLVDNTIVGANRAGIRLTYDHNSKVVEAHVALGDWRQLFPTTKLNASQVGFVDGFFLLQRNGFGTLGRDRQVGLYLAWHLPADDLTFDGVEDYLSRPADAGQSIDTVATRAPQMVVSWAHHFNDRLLTVAGYGRYQLSGTWATTPVNAVYGDLFGGVQFATGPHTALLVEARRYALIGLPSIPGGPPPDMHGTALIVDQRIAL
ncbi:MAG: hypothetical protein JO030_01760 [Candidatus Eremiobacteraeota bacterium]|nr:hypothetical protein [Candidatus Eremiobacteraeota bacterium]